MNARWLDGLLALRREGWVEEEASLAECCGEEERYGWEEPNQSSCDLTHPRIVSLVEPWAWQIGNLRRAG